MGMIGSSGLGGDSGSSPLGKPPSFGGRFIPSSGGGAPAFATTKSLLFNGTTGIVNGTNQSGQNMSTAMTLSCWVKSPNTADYAAICGKNDVAAFATTASYVILRSGFTAGKMHVTLIGNNGKVKQYVSSITCFDNTWHMIGFTFGNSTLKLYVDGVLDTNPTVAQDTGAFATLNSASLPSFSIGAETSSGTINSPYNKWVSNVALFNVEFSATDMANLKNGSSPADISQHAQFANCKGWYRCGDGDASGANGIVDSSGNSYHLAITGGVTIDTDHP